MSSQGKLGVLLVVSGPSGCGKTTLCRRLQQESAGQVVYSISCTTRPMRVGEVNHVDYHFLTKEEFLCHCEEGHFLEYAEVHGNCYGTLRSDVVDLLSAGKDVIMDIDVQGAASVRCVEDAIINATYADIYIHVPTQELENRLRGRETDSDEVIQLRLKNAAEEDAQSHLYQYCFDSATKEEDYTRFVLILETARARVRIP